MIVLGGLWVAWLGYTVLYAGVAKINGDTSCTIGKAARGQCSGTAPAAHGGPQPGRTSEERRRAVLVAQHSLAPVNYLGASVG